MLIISCLIILLLFVILKRKELSMFKLNNGIITDDDRLHELVCEILDIVSAQDTDVIGAMFAACLEDNTENWIANTVDTDAIVDEIKDKFEYEDIDDNTNNNGLSIRTVDHAYTNNTAGTEVNEGGADRTITTPDIHISMVGDPTVTVNNHQVRRITMSIVNNNNQDINEDDGKVTCSSCGFRAIRGRSTCPICGSEYERAVIDN